MLQVHKKLKLNTKFVPETVIHIKIYFWSFADHHHTQKYFYNGNITLNKVHNRSTRAKCEIYSRSS